MAKIVITTDTDAEAVWFIELCRKIGQKLEVYFGNSDIAPIRAQLSEVREKLPCPPESYHYSKIPFKGEDLARYLKHFKGKNRKR